jgi:hypothetical protein
MVDVAKGTSLLIKVGNGAQTEVFAHPCMINTSRSVSFDAAVNSDNVEDCANPDNPATVHTFKSARSFSIDGAGKLDAGDTRDWIGYLASPDPVNVQVWLGATMLVQAPVQVTKFAITGGNHANAEVSISLVSDGWDGTVASA